ncbi:Uma2 family endonuclease [Ornithinimicrobium faecis]|uniref:Uma2 family endonuclease n=1 Tax=Ornithinimicrobium faecis TaxID=2934158 RepID=A0ABY4YPR6_9MICO|nr:MULTISPECIES: Uma2 family endonuclease [unclassified Ornithinimicrobium]USQ78751.1 Uma2 family endonuclease [Ornithinimicrobium sp. HY1793]
MPMLTDRTTEHRISRDHFERIREAGSELLRFELLDGEVLVTPSPSTPHQRPVMRLALTLGPLLPEGTELLGAPYDVLLDDAAEGDTTLQPDLLVARTADLTYANLPAAPVLVVEVLSPSTWRRDLGAKRDAYARAGVAHYWVLAPDMPSLTAYRLDPSGGYREEAHVIGDEQWATTSPVEITLCPADLIR